MSSGKHRPTVVWTDIPRSARDRLVGVMRVHEVVRWWNSRHEDLDWTSPAEVYQTAAGQQRVQRLIDQMVTGE